MNKQVDGEQIRMFEALVLEVMQDTNARGIAAAVVDKKGQLLYENYFGYRDAEQKLEINQDTLFGLASVTKSFTALSIMQLVEKGKIGLHDPISKYIPEFTNRNQEYPVTIEHLITHSGGYFPLPRIIVEKVMEETGIKDTLEEELIYNDAFAQEGVKRVAERLDSQKTHTGRPGELMSYCNDGYGLLSDIIRRYGGCGSFAEYVEKNILQPLGMDRSHMSFIRAEQDENAAVLYSYENNSWIIDKNFKNDAFVLNGGGAMKSTLSDMIRYVTMYMNEGVGCNGAEVANQYLVREMIKPRQYMKPGQYYGYGLQISQLGDIRIVEHGGSLPGVSSNFAWSPEAEIGVVILCNTMDVPVAYLSNALFRLFCGYPIHAKRQEHEQYEWSEEYKKKISGSYVSGEGDSFTLSFDSDGHADFVVNGKRTELKPIYHNEALVRKKYSDMYVQIQEDQERGIWGARYGSRIFPKVK